MRPIKRAIVLCWIMLVACFVIKLFGGNWFEVVCTNEHFIMVCDFIENNIILYQLLSFFVYLIPTFFMTITMCGIIKPKPKEIIVVFAFLAIAWISKFISHEIKSCFEFLSFFSLPIILNANNVVCIKKSIKSNWYKGILGTVLILAFQMISLFTRNIGIKIVKDNLVVSFILLIDYYIMIALYYLYMKTRKEIKNG